MLGSLAKPPDSQHITNLLMQFIDARESSPDTEPV